MVLSGKEGSTREKSYWGNSEEMMSRGEPVSQGLSAFSCHRAEGITGSVLECMLLEIASLKFNWLSSLLTDTNDRCQFLSEIMARDFA